MSAHRTVLAATCWALSFFLIIAGCGDEEKAPEGAAGKTHNSSNPSCAAIMAVCHAADLGPGTPTGDCHTVAHHDVEAPCADRKTNCIEICEQELSDGGSD